MGIRAFGWRMTRKARSNTRGFVKQLKEFCRHGTKLRARQATEDLKEVRNRINLDRIRENRQEETMKRIAAILAVVFVTGLVASTALSGGL